MRHEIEIAQKMRQIEPTVAVMLHDRKIPFLGDKLFFGIENAKVVSFSCGSSVLDAGYLQPLLSRRLAGKLSFNARWSRLRRASLQISESFSAQAHSVLSAFCVFSDVSAAAIVADVPRAKADNQQNWHSMVSRPPGGVTSRPSTQPRALRSVGSHTRKNAAARFSIVQGSETYSRGATIGYIV